MHGQYIVCNDRQIISEEETYLWVSRGALKADMESKITAA
jgi:hypothetical protein